MRGSLLVRSDAELGEVRLCRRCGEEWPFDPEFWYFARRDGSVMGHCRACWSERNRRQHAERKAVPA